MELNVQKREKFGTIATIKLRGEGLIPAELYGHGVPNMHLAVSVKEFNKIYKEAGESTLVTLVIGGEKRPVLISDVELDPVRGSITHADFYQVRLDEKTKAHVPILLTGVSIGVKEKGGILIHSMREIEIEALPADLPHDIKVDISGLDDVGKSLYVKDLAKVHGVHFMADLETVIVSISAHVEEKIEVTPVSVDDVKVEGEEKRKEKELSQAEEASSTNTAEKK